MAKKKSEAEIEAEKQAAIQRLRPLLPVGTTIYTVLRHVNRERTGGVVAVLIPFEGKILNISGAVAEATGHKWDDRDGVWANSQFGVVTHLSYAMHGYDSKGKGHETIHGEQDADNFHAGYSFEHKQL